MSFAVLSPAAALNLGAADAPARKRVAIIMDDGPFPGHNATYRELYAREQIHITLAHVGKNVVAYPELTQASAAAGHEIANHSFTHPHLKTLDDAAVAKEIVDTQAAVKQATGKAPAWFWAPYLEHDDRVDAVVRQATGLEHFPFTKYHFTSTDDWNTATPAEQFRERATKGIVDGTVILMQEWPKVTFENLEWVIKELKQQNVEFLTFSELAK